MSATQFYLLNTKIEKSIRLSFVLQFKQLKNLHYYYFDTCPSALKWLLYK